MLLSAVPPQMIFIQNGVIDPNELKSDSSLKEIKLSAADWPQKMWWKSFNDPQITSLTEESLSSSPSLMLDGKSERSVPLFRSRQAAKH